MARWEFEDLKASHVEQELTQRDQFNNDDVELAEALVREVIQNSTDAPAGTGVVKVRFAVVERTGEQARRIQDIFTGLRPHLRACEIDTAVLDRPTVRLLVVEDFNTKGLTGDPAALDEENFRNFWRRHGKSGKGGKSGGRWGLGKLVYSTSSQIRSFFGFTIRAGDPSALLMGQAVLSNHVLNSRRHPAHGFWFGARGNDDIQLPVTDVALVSQLAQLFGIARQGQTGLSLVIPFPNPDITEQGIIGGVVRNYYFPILAGRLAVEVGSITIDATTFHQVAASVPNTGAGAAGTKIPLDFVEVVSRQLDQQPLLTAQTAINGGGLGSSSFTEAQLAAMKEAFSANRLLHVRIPVRLKPKPSGDRNSHIDLFLKPAPDGEKPFALFARGSITVPGENRYFSGTHAHGAMVASDEGVVAFLGDAENPAHTAWNANAEKLAKAWRAPSQTLRHIRYALRELFTLIADKVEQEDRDALVDFFSLADLSRSTQGPKKKVKVVIPPLPKKETAIRIQSRKGGFSVVPGPAAENWEFPKTVDVRVAYDVIGGNGFSLHSKFDFDLAADEVNIEAQNLSFTPVRPNKLRLSIAGPEFDLTLSGFDENRDIVVDARTV
ncbi:hypothetical protein CT676_27700 [Bradyrhizobium sp. MOS001]|uniref:hypothetical protein n=1 Tax=Bradyrhizobium sp. MOS001 TaxID=2133948 RepID=UPI0010750789|nr:hypothetical protein [Bradyrhizobium sp. MOS001]TFW57791.1 hypothetical protein CT676_27700 [Bradyrhizobium sp. MOS001]